MDADINLVSRVEELERTVAELTVLASVALVMLDKTNAYHSGKLLEMVEQLVAEAPDRVDFADAAEIVRDMLTPASDYYSQVDPPIRG